jgi:hypothetical protein
VEWIDEIRTRNEEEIKKGVSATAKGGAFKEKRGH